MSVQAGALPWARSASVPQPPRILSIVAAALAVAVLGPPAVAGTGPSTTPPPSLEWGGERFTSKDELRAWLEARGYVYEVWAQRHPAAANRIEMIDRFDQTEEGRSWGLLAPLAIGGLAVAALALLAAARPPAALERQRGSLVAFGVGTIVALAVAALFVVEGAV